MSDQGRSANLSELISAIEDHRPPRSVVPPPAADGHIDELTALLSRLAFIRGRMRAGGLNLDESVLADYEDYVAGQIDVQNGVVRAEKLATSINKLSQTELALLNAVRSSGALERRVVAEMSKELSPEGDDIGRLIDLGLLRLVSIDGMEVLTLTERGFDGASRLSRELSNASTHLLSLAGASTPQPTHISWLRRSLEALIAELSRRQTVRVGVPAMYAELFPTSSIQDYDDYEVVAHVGVQDAARQALAVAEAQTALRDLASERTVSVGELMEALLTPLYDSSQTAAIRGKFEDLRRRSRNVYVDVSEISSNSSALG